jgi:hypothetical protein
MFDLWGKRKQRRKEELRYALLDGEVRALLLVMGSMIDLLPAEKREVLIEVLKIQVGQGFTSNATWYDEEAKQLYNDSLSLSLRGGRKRKAVSMSRSHRATGLTIRSNGSAY